MAATFGSGIFGNGTLGNFGSDMPVRVRLGSGISGNATEGRLMPGNRRSRSCSRGLPGSRS